MLRDETDKELGNFLLAFTYGLHNGIYNSQDISKNFEFEKRK